MTETPGGHQSLFATYNEITGFPSLTGPVTSSGTAPVTQSTEAAVPLTATIETVPLSVAFSEHVAPTLPSSESLAETQIQGTSSEPQGQDTIVGAQPVNPATQIAEQTQTTSLPLPQSQGQPQGQTPPSSESNVDYTQFELAPRFTAPDSTTPVPPSDP